MENLIFEKWIDLGAGVSGLLKVARKVSEEDMLILLFIKDRPASIPASPTETRTVLLKVQGRAVTSDTGTTVDFGTAYPIATPEGKVTITKQFMKAFLK